MSEYYNEWRSTALTTNQNFFKEKEIQKEEDRPQSIDEQKPQQPYVNEALKGSIRQQFILDKSKALPHLNPPSTKNASAFQTTSQFYQQLTQSSLHRNPPLSQSKSSLLETLPPSAFEVAAKKESTIWKTEQYKDELFRKHLSNTVHRQVFQYDAEVAQKLRGDKYNIRVTNIGEYANALNRNRVFINPKFSSC
ncbi:hypothetical protein FGO68_gene4427 [Halteria grandinella]|uniref:Uncharacterized protein n=1 Tax=Halteria grandinella TaxID=5974 RepID=A0A8J8SZ61_HALGN|nr:hypothetical protein FGO68_gene4427 [Halteria grandinella]